MIASIVGERRPANAVEDHGLDPHEIDALDGVLIVPNLHVSGVCAEQIVESVPEAFAALPPRTAPAHPVIRPSATSDIELTHRTGPRPPHTDRPRRIVAGCDGPAPFGGGLGRAQAREIRRGR